MRDIRMYNPTHRFETSSMSPVVQNPRVAWKYSFQEGEVDYISVWNKTAYCIVDGGRVIIALSEDGTPQWRHEMHDPVGHSDDTYWGFPAVTNDTLYIVSKGGDLYAFDSNSGDLCWCSEEIGQIPVDSPAVVDGTVYMGGHSGDVFAANASNGNQRWRYESERVGATTPAVTDGVVYFAHSKAGIVYALDADSGDQRWFTKTNVERPSTPTVVAGTVYISGDDGTLCALDASSGNQRWCVELSTATLSIPAVVDGTVYVGSSDLYALDANSGDQYWRFEPGGFSPFAPPTVVNGTVYVAAGDIYAVDADSGDQYWCFETDDNPWPVVAGDDTVYFGDGVTVYALEEENTKESGEITKLKLETECAACGADLSECADVDFCPECGVERTAELDCSGCGTDLTQYGDVDLNFCPECGCEVSYDVDSTNAKIYDK
jgi:outer membrane protein assembly factor BamB